jgi:large subunit ribosomal protein L2
MAIKQMKPTTPGQRGMTTRDFSEITAKKPIKSLITNKKITAGRNNKGRITTRHKGGGVKRYIRIVNFNLPAGTTATIEAIEYDPGRTANIARIVDQEKQYHYVLAAEGMKVGNTIQSGPEAPVAVGNRLPLSKIPNGSTIYAVELKPGFGAQLVRSAGNRAQLVAKDDKYCQVRLPSGEVRMILSDAMATIGNVGNIQHQNVKYGKAGRKRKMGVRPTVRGVVMNAADHPHGGGDGGRHGIGGGVNHGAAPRTPWGQKTLGYKTRSRRKNNSLIVRTRHEAKRKKG